MTKRMGTKAVKQMAADFEVEDKDILKIEAWMGENVGSFETVGALADAAMMEFPEHADDDDLFYELAFLFESVVG